jgi:drug/metabolite transporter (DMT)-like permease
VAVLLALFTAVSYGVGDFSGGMASRRATPLTVTATAHAVGLTGLLVVAALVGATQVRGVDLLLGGVGGVCGCIGVVLLYQGLSTGSMAIVSPISAVIAAAVPVTGGLIAGERPGGIALIGIVIALVAIVLVSRAGPMGRPAPGPLLAAVGSGIGFGLFFLCVSGIQEEAGLWPLVLARVVSLTVAVSLAMIRRVPVVAPGPVFGLAVAAGLLDVTANVTFLLATQRGLLAVVAVIASLYPATTVVLAMSVGRERVSATQAWGLAAAAAALVLITV